MILSFILYRIPSPFLCFFYPLGKKKIFQNVIFFHRDEKKWIFLLYGANFFLKLNFKNLKVVLEAAEAAEATIMNTQTLKELGIERKKVPSNIRNEKSPLDFCSISDRSVSSGGTLLPRVGFTAPSSIISDVGWDFLLFYTEFL